MDVFKFHMSKKFELFPDIFILIFSANYYPQIIPSTVKLHKMFVDFVEGFLFLTVVSMFIMN